MNITTKTETLLMGALLGTGMVQPVQTASKGGTVTFLCRQVPGQERSWIGVVDQLLMAMEVLEQTLPGSDVHLCRKYLRKDGQMVYGWNFSISTRKAKDLDLVLPVILPVLQAARPSLTLVPLADAQPEPSHQQNQASGGQLPFHPPQEKPEVRNKPLIRVVRSGTTDSGAATSEVEVPLPHASADRNRPNRNGKGARLISTSTRQQQRR